MSASFQLIGLGQVLTNLQLYHQASEKAGERAVKYTIISIDRYAKLTCPVGTPESTHRKKYHGGRLRASLHFRFPSRFVAEEVTNVFYAPYVELGTRRMRARPFLYPSLMRNVLYFLKLCQAMLP